MNIIDYNVKNYELQKIELNNKEGFETLKIAENEGLKS